MRKPQRILVPVDYSIPSGVALETALSMAHSYGAEVEVLHCWSMPDRIPAVAEVLQQQADRARQEMDAFIAKFEAPDGVVLASRVMMGSAEQSICALSSEYDLVVMGTHGRTGLDRLLVGSVASRVVQNASCPVMTVREPRVVKHAREAQVVHAMFDDRAHLERAFAELERRGIDPEKVSLLMSEDTHDRDFQLLDQTKALSGATAGGLMGGTIGGILGGLIGIGSVVSGGIGLVVMGPALAFAAVGGLFGGLLGRTVPADRALVLKGELAAGRMLMAVHLDDPSQVKVALDVVKGCQGELLEW